MTTPTRQREELVAIMSRWGIEAPPGVMNDVLAWHTRHQASVSREEIEKVVKDHTLVAPCYFKREDRGRHVVPDERFINALHALLSRQKREWCGCIKLINGNYRLMEFRGDSTKEYLWGDLDNWKLCPICGVKRPE